jgi:plastocyanin
MIALRLAAAAILSLAAAVPAVGQQPAVQTIYVSSFNFTPKPIHLAAGQPVTLTFVNRSGSSHDFTARDLFGRARILAGAAPGGEIDLRGGESKSITIVPAAGVYHAHCSHFLHEQLGMSDEIIVN